MFIFGPFWPIFGQTRIFPEKNGYTIWISHPFQMSEISKLLNFILKSKLQIFCKIFFKKLCIKSHKTCLLYVSYQNKRIFMCIITFFCPKISVLWTNLHYLSRFHHNLKAHNYYQKLIRIYLGFYLKYFDSVKKYRIINLLRVAFSILDGLFL